MHGRRRRGGSRAMRVFTVLAIAVSALTLTGITSILPAAAAARPPSMPTDVRLTDGDTFVLVGGPAPADNGSPITSYTAGCVANGVTKTASASSLPVKIAGLTNGAHYSCWLAARNAAGAGPRSYLLFAIPGKAYAMSTVNFCSPGGTALFMDLYRPAGAGPFPVVMFVHGGGWWAGTRDLSDSVLPRLFNNAGYVLASIDYRLAPKYKEPLQVQDVACAVRYLRANQTKLGIRATKVGGIGWSAGGNLVALLATAPKTAMIDTGQWLGYSSKLNAVNSSFGIAEFGQADITSDSALLKWIFGTDDPNVLRRWAPITYVTPDDPPFLLLHGTRDTIVVVKQSRDFQAALAAVRVPVRLIEVQHTEHRFVPVDGDPSPSMDAVYSATVSFFDGLLK